MVDLATLKICFVAGTLGQGGAEHQLYYMLQTLCACDAHPRVVCLTQGEYWEDRIRALGVPVVWIGRRASKAARLARLLRVLRADPPDILQSQHFYTNLYVAAAARMLGLREIGAVRSDVFLEFLHMGKVLGTLGLRLPRVVAANSQAAVENAVAAGVPRSRLQFLLNVVDTEQYKPAVRVERQVVRLIAVGNLRAVKRYDRLLRVVAQLQERAPGRLHVVIAGSGPLRATLEEQAGELKLLPDVVTFKGAVSDVAALYRTGDLFVMTSDREGTPNALLEAMAAGLPIIATNVGGIADVVEHGETGYLVDPADEEGLVEALSRVIYQPTLRSAMAQRARAYVAAEHALDRLPGYLRALYTRALA